MKIQGEAIYKLTKDHESRTEGHSKLIREQETELDELKAVKNRL
jgi:hypothetical protein